MTGLDLLDDKQRALYIDGTWREANSGDRFDVHDPADGSVICSVADAAPTDAMDALDAAAAAQHDWARTAPRERGEILRRAFGLLTQRADDFAHLMSLEMGKTVAEGKGEVTYGSEFFRWFSEEAVRVHGRWMQAPAGGSRTAHHPQAGRAVPVHHPVELPARHGHPQDRPGGRRRLHDGDQARRRDAAVDARPGRADGGGGSAAGRPQRDHRPTAPARSGPR